jgi:c-di-GMP-binding flagellar brake protein YcgR
METVHDVGKEQIDRRENKRHSVPAMVTCSFYEGGIKGKSSFQGFIQDISLGGVSIEIRDDFFIISEALLLYTTVEMSVALNFPDGVHPMDFTGVIRWCRRRKEESRNFLYLGIKFHNLSEENQALVRQYMSFGQGDKNLIWNLWDTL